jgi:predicted NBD/HSP70 family sugar kinase
MNVQKQTESILRSLGADEKRALWAISLADSIGKEDLAQRLSWGSSKLNTCLAGVKRKNVLSVSTLAKDGTGRKPMSFSVAPGLGCFVGIHCDIATDSFVLLDASGRLIKEMEYPAFPWEDSDGLAFLDALEAFLAPEFRDAILAVGISSAIQFSKPGGSTLRGPSFTNDSALLLARAIEGRFGVPVSVGRPQVLMCYQGDLRSLVYRQESFINIIVTDHLGIAIIVNGERWLGQSGLSGDLGHLKVAGNDRSCYCGASGCLRTKITYMGICQEARERLADLEREGGNPDLDPAGFEGPSYRSGVEQLIEAANRHNTLASAILHDAATELGTALATVVSLFNPARLFVHSILTEARDLFSEQVRLMIRKNCLELYSRNLILEFCSYSPASNAMGAAAFSRDGYFRKVLEIG